MSKMCRFSTSIFQGFGLDFGGSWASKMEPSSLFWPQKIAVPALLKRLKLSVLLKWRLGGPQARFWRPQGSIWEGLGAISTRFSLLKQQRFCDLQSAKTLRFSNSSSSNDLCFSRSICSMYYATHTGIHAHTTHTRTSGPPSHSR